MILVQYKTADIVLAAYLRLSGIKMAGIEKQGHRGTFVFENVPKQLPTTYDLGLAMVEAVAFNNMIKTLTTAVRRME